MGKKIKRNFRWAKREGEVAIKLHKGVVVNPWLCIIESSDERRDLDYRHIKYSQNAFGLGTS